ncbi:MAG: hypothetical protein WD894_20455 [Pirellulales bacterium]
MKPSKLATLLTDKFLHEGNFELAGSPTTELTQASARAFGEFSDDAFANLSVQAVGYAEEGSEEEAVYIYVTKGTKRAFASLPEEVGDVPIIVENVGKIIVRPRATISNRGNIFDRAGRVACGSSCAPSGKDYSGTFGALVMKSADPDSLFILSNNHVIADCNHLSVGMPIMSPSGNDSRPGNPPRMIGAHSEMTELRSGVPGLVPPCRDDLAIGEVADPNSVSSWQGDAGGFDTPTASKSPAPDMLVKKFGRTTGLTHGKIQSEVVQTPVRYESENFKAIVWFRQVWVVRSVDSDPFAVGGDSGSLVVTEDGNHAVGIVFASNNRGGYVNIMSIDRVLSAFGGLTLVGGHGV